LNSKKSATVILGGGSALGLAHIGVLSVLEQNYEIGAIIGTSIGAVVGALYALGLDTDHILEIAGRQSNAQVFSPFNLDRRIRGIFDGRHIHDLFKDWTSLLSIEEGRIPFLAVAYDLNSRSTVLINRGAFADAMRASSSLPLIFSPYRYGKYLFVDGGIEHPLPLSFAKMYKHDVVISVNVLPLVEHEAVMIEPQILETIKRKRIHSSEILLQAVLQNQGYLALKDTIAYEPDIVIEAALPEGRPYAFHKSKMFYDYGYKICTETLAEYREPTFIDKIRRHYSNLTARIQKVKDIS
jgi:NTE family protein